VIKEEVRQDESTTVERDAEGGVRDITTRSYENRAVMIDRPGGMREPLIIRETEPRVEGIIIVCEGGGDPVVRDALTRAAMALLNLPAHKIEVFPM
jgi:stage III sporulation protein AG